MSCFDIAKKYDIVEYKLEALRLVEQVYKKEFKIGIEGTIVPNIEELKKYIISHNQEYGGKSNADILALEIDNVSNLNIIWNAKNQGHSLKVIGEYLSNYKKAGCIGTGELLNTSEFKVDLSAAERSIYESIANMYQLQLEKKF